MKFEERWSLIGSRAERIDMADGRTGVLVNAETPPFSPVKDRRFRVLLAKGALRRVMVRIASAPEEPEEPAPPAAPVEEIALAMEAPQSSREEVAVQAGDEEVEVEVEVEDLPPAHSPSTPLHDVLGVPQRILQSLEDFGYVLLEDLDGVTPDDLMLVDGIGPKTAREILAAITVNM